MFVHPPAMFVHPPTFMSHLYSYCIQHFLLKHIVSVFMFYADEPYGLRPTKDKLYTVPYTDQI
jgi:hypothetical protein